MNKKSIILTLVILAILAFSTVAFIPNLAAAEGGRNVHFGPTQDELDAAKVRSSAGSGIDSSVGGRNTYVTEYVLVERPVSRTQTTVETEEVESVDEDENISDMAANALFGGSTFMPSGIVQWILFAIFILLMVILVRKLSGAEHAYHAEPLKHH